MSTSSPILDHFTVEEQKEVVAAVKEATDAGVVMIFDDKYRLRPTDETKHLVTAKIRERIGIYKQVISDVIMHNEASWVLGGIQPPEICPYCGERLREPFEVHPRADVNQRSMF